MDGTICRYMGNKTEGGRRVSDKITHVKGTIDYLFVTPDKMEKVWKNTSNKDSWNRTNNLKAGLMWCCIG